MRAVVLAALLVSAFTVMMWPAGRSRCRLPIRRASPTSPPPINSASSAIAIRSAPSLLTARGWPTPKGASFASCPSAAVSPMTLGPGEGQIRHLTWTTNSTDRRRGRDAVRTMVVVSNRERGPRTVMGPGARQRAATTDLRCEWPGMRRSEVHVERRGIGSPLWRLASSFTRIEGRPSWPAFRPNGDVACIVNARLTLPCGAAPSEARCRS